jgi:hypothetical protein
VLGPWHECPQRGQARERLDSGRGILGIFSWELGHFAVVVVEEMIEYEEDQSQRKSQVRWLDSRVGRLEVMESLSAIFLAWPHSEGTGAGLNCV